MKKIDQSPYKDFIIDSLLDGISPKELEIKLRQKGFRISHTSLHKYKKELEGKEEMSTNSGEPPLTILATNDRNIKEKEIEPEKDATVDNILLAAKNLLYNQIKIVQFKQKKYKEALGTEIEIETAYYDTELKDANTLATLLVNLTKNNTVLSSVHNQLGKESENKKVVGDRCSNQIADKKIIPFSQFALDVKSKVKSNDYRTTAKFYAAYLKNEIKKLGNEIYSRLPIKSIIPTDSFLNELDKSHFNIENLYTNDMIDLYEEMETIYNRKA